MVDLSRPVGDLPEPPDDGSVPAGLAAVLADRARGVAGIREVAEALAGVRLLAPLLEVSGDELEGSDTDPCAGQDRAVAAVSVRGPDGATGLGFTSLDALVRWDPRARPWPTPAPRLAAAVLADHGVRLVVDPGSAQQVELSGPALHRLAAGLPWPDPWVDPEVRAAIGAELAPVLVSGEVAVRLGPAPPQAPGEALLVAVDFPAGTDAAVASQRAEVIARRLARNAALRAVFDATLVVTARVRDDPARSAPPRWLDSPSR